MYKHEKRYVMGIVKYSWSANLDYLIILFLLFFYIIY
nr:MAG TPA: hypothetical protein [Caudoviricetes sp.]